MNYNVNDENKKKANGRKGAGIVQLRKDKLELNGWSLRSLAPHFDVSHSFVRKAIENRSDSPEAIEIRKFTDNVLKLPIEGDYFDA